MSSLPQIIRFGDFTVNRTRFELWRSGERIEIKPKSLDLLVYLIDHRDRVVEKDEIMEALWSETLVSEGSLSNLIYELRASLDDDARAQAIIETIRGRGVRFVAEVEPREEDRVVSKDLDSSVSRPRLSEAVFVMSLCAFIPNSILAGLNYAYNSSQVVTDSIRPAFEMVVAWYNPVVFPLSLCAGLIFAWKAFRPLQSDPGVEASFSARQRALLLGHGIALVGVVSWVLAGIFYPWLIDLMTDLVNAEGTLHFFASLALCGLVAPVFPFFSMTSYTLHRIYPGLGGSGQESDQATLLRLRQLAGAYLLAAGGVPLLSITLLAITGEHERLVLAWVSGIGILALGAAFGMYRRVLTQIAGYTSESDPF